MKNKLLVIDSHSLIHRAYHALPPLETKKKEIVNAVYGFFSVLIKIVQETNPSHIAAVFDFPAPTFRHKKFKEYKIKRTPTPEELILQIPKIKESLIDFGIPIFEKKGFEADDVIGFICAASLKTNSEVIVISGDADILQLIDDRVRIYLLRKGIKDTVLCDIEKVKESYQGLLPKQLIDYKGLRGDPSDNIPGVPGIGEKTAISLIKNFKTLENLYAEIRKGRAELNEKTIDKLLRFEKEAFFSRDLVSIEKNVPIDFILEKCEWKGWEEKAERIFGEFEFHSLVKRIARSNNLENNLSLF